MSLLVLPALTELRAEEAEMQARETAAKFALVVTNSRCYLCHEKIGELRWQMGEIGAEKELVHTSCLETEIEAARARKAVEDAKPQVPRFPKGDGFKTDKATLSSFWNLIEADSNSGGALAHPEAGKPTPRKAA